MLVHFLEYVLLFKMLRDLAGNLLSIAIADLQIPLFKKADDAVM